MSRAVVIIAPATDSHALVVAKRLEALGCHPVLLDSALYPSEWSLTVSLADGAPFRYALEHDGTALEESDIAGVWWRRPRRFLAPASVREEHLRRFVGSESRQAFYGWLYCLGRKVINPVGADSIASHKLLQLRCAGEVGLRIPRSLATNSPARAQEFCEPLESGFVFKPFTGTAWQFTGTQRVTSETLRNFDSVAYAPVIFQEEIDKTADIRVNVLDGQIFAALIRSRAPEAPLDWRVDPVCDHVPHELPIDIQRALVALMSRLGLRFGACDLALTEHGEYVFFEVNPGGQWLFEEILTGQELSLAFARALLNGPPEAAGQELANTVRRRATVATVA